MRREAGLTLWQHMALIERLPGEYAEKLIEFQRHVIKLRKQQMHMLHHFGNADESPVYFNIPPM
jgi:hypothetical protein